MDHPSASSAPRKRVSGWYYPWIFVAGFVLLIGADAVMVHLAMTSFPGVVSKDPFAEGNSHNQALAAARAQEALGWTVQADYVPERGTLEAVLTVTLGEGADPKTGTGAVPISQAKVLARFLRPNREGLDFEQELGEVKPGLYRQKITVPAVGVWAIHIVVKHTKGEYQLEKRIFQPALSAAGGA
jgi:nitrogen fixation protein FixH